MSSLLTFRRPVGDSRADLFIVLALAAALRVLMLGLTSDTYDYDEFVLLLLGRDYAHGAIPYHTFMFFHPPGALVLLRLLNPVMSTWWPAGRILTAALDCITAGLVWACARTVFGQRSALFAGLLYAGSPLALIAAVRIGQDPLVTCLGVGGLYLLLRFPLWRSALLAGGLLGLAFWIKYPALYFLPVYLLARPRSAPAVLAGLVVTVLALFLPFAPQWHDLYQQTVEFQRTRWLMVPDQRVITTLLWWLGVNVPAAAALVFVRRPLWVVSGFLLGAAFILTSQVYYHYFVSVVPFAAILGGAALSRVHHLRPAVVAAVLAGLAALWGLWLEVGGSSPLYVTAAHLSDIRPAVQILRRDTPPGSTVLSDRYEYPFLANRRSLAHYFWNVGVLVDARYLETRLPPARAVVLSYGASSGYPPGFTGYLDARFPRLNTKAATVWLTSRRSGRP